MNGQARKSVFELRKAHVEWVIEAAGHNLGIAALVLETSVSELRSWVEKRGVSVLPPVQNLDTIDKGRQEAILVGPEARV